MNVSVNMDRAHSLESIVIKLYASEAELLQNTTVDEHYYHGFYNCVGFEYLFYSEFDDIIFDGESGEDSSGRDSTYYSSAK